MAEAVVALWSPCSHVARALHSLWPSSESPGAWSQSAGLGKVFSLRGAHGHERGDLVGPP